MLISSNIKFSFLSYLHLWVKFLQNAFRLSGIRIENLIETRKPTPVTKQFSCTLRFPQLNSDLRGFHPSHKDMLNHFELYMQWFLNIEIPFKLYANSLFRIRNLIFRKTFVRTKNLHKTWVNEIAFVFMEVCIQKILLQFSFSSQRKERVVDAFFVDEWYN